MIDNLEPFLHELCDAAAVETLKWFRQPIKVLNKEAGHENNTTFDPVTRADREVESIIRRMIGKKYPDHGILGEEFGEENMGSEYCWIIDPIDGTRSYITGIPLWGTLIGLYYNSRPFAGIMHQPFTDEKYLSDGSTSIFIGNNNRKRIVSRQTRTLSDCVVLTTSPELFDTAELEAYRAVESKCRFARYGMDCYAYAMVAAGYADLVVESRLHIYDIAALIPIIENAGGRVTDWQGGSSAQGGQVLACSNEEIHFQALEALNA